MSYVVIQQPLMNGGYSFRHTELDTYYTLVEQNEGVRRVVDTDGEYTAYGAHILETLNSQKQMELELAISRMEAANAQLNPQPDLAVSLISLLTKRLDALEATVKSMKADVDRANMFTRPIGGSTEPILCGNDFYGVKNAYRNLKVEVKSDQDVTIAPDPDFAWAKREMESR